MFSIFSGFICFIYTATLSTKLVLWFVYAHWRDFYIYMTLKSKNTITANWPMLDSNFSSSFKQAYLDHVLKEEQHLSIFLSTYWIFQAFP